MEVAVNWASEFNVDVTLLDQQHKKLFSLIEQLRLTLVGSAQDRGIDEIVSALGQYAEAHFLSEERLMLQSAYPEYEGHKSAHESMVGRIEQFQRELRDGNPSVVEELHAYLVSWWTSHILGTDKNYCSHFARNGIH
jgi:hemerythrin-like metal-binding protein